MFRLFNTVALMSAILLSVTFILFITAFRRSSCGPLVSFSRDFHITVIEGRGNDPGARIAFFSDPRGPYRGSIISLGGDDGIEKSGYGDRWGIYYRYFRWPTGEVLWTLMVTLWYPIVLFSILPVVWVMRHYRSRFPVVPDSTNTG